MQEHLFYKYDLSNVILEQDKKLSIEIQSLSQDYIFNSDESKLVEYFVSKYTIDPIILDKDNVTIDQSEVDIDVRNDRTRDIRDRSKPCYFKGNRITFFIPYSGDKILFFCRASTFSSLLPSADVRETEIVYSIDTIEYDESKIKSDYQHNVANILQHIEWVNNDVQRFNNSLEAKVYSQIHQRKEKLNHNLSLINKLGYPLRRRENIPQTYTVPTVKKKIIPSLPTIKHKNLPPEPILDNLAYDSILTTITNMSLTMERSPKTFAKLKEEELRDHFLIVLNSQFEGDASGETFNYEGKTDILIRVNNKNIFIAECKIWKGEQVLLDTITQLLGYVSWRDTKTAILIFNKNKEFTKVLNQIVKIVESHPNHIKKIKYDNDTGFRFILRHRDDKEKELILTILLFNIPIESGKP